MDKKLLWIVAWLFPLTASAQEFVLNDSLRLQEITIVGSRLKEFSSGHKIESIDSVAMFRHRSGTLADLLKNNSVLYIHSYGPAALATCSFRGLTANHTAIIWNGFNLQSLMNGQLDLNLLPVYLMEDVQLQHGGSGALFGSGAVGGAIHLNEQASFGSGLKFSSYAGAGSFGQAQTGHTVAWGAKNFYSSTKFFFSRADNDFTFRNRAKADSPQERFAHAGHRQFNFLQQNKILFSERSSLQLNLWLLSSDRQIPASITSKPSKSHQNDDAIRISSEYRHDFDKMCLLIRSGFLSEQIFFKDPDTWTDAKSNAKTSVTEIEARYRLSRSFALNSGFQFEYGTATTENYPANLDQSRLSTFGSIRYSHPYRHLNAIASLRHSVVNGKPIPLIPALELEYGISEWSSMKANIARTYRLPTFNDLYWIPYGNPNLKPEGGWSQEITNETTLSAINTRISATLFNSALSDFIKWQPDEDGFFRPDNISKAWSRGLETSVASKTAFRGIQMEFIGKYNLIWSTQRFEDNKAEKGYRNLQLIYIPRHSASAALNISKGHISMYYRHQLTGERYTTSDNSNEYALPAYHTADAIIMWDFAIHKTRFGAQGKINNVWNAEYESVAFYPVPGRNFQIAINVNFN